jgi:hypothetical protein
MDREGGQGFRDSAAWFWHDSQVGWANCGITGEVMVECEWFLEVLVCEVVCVAIDG